MRAFNILRALSERNRIFLLVADALHSDRGEDADEELRNMCESIIRIRLPWWRNLYARLLRFVRLQLPCLFRMAGKKPVEFSCAQLVTKNALDGVLNESFDRIFVFRLYVYPIAELLKKSNPQAAIYLDLDDIESITRSRISALYRKNGASCESASLQIEADFFERLEKEVLPRCDRVFVASQKDSRILPARTGASNLYLLPNVYAPRSEPSSPPGSSGFTFLFIGTYGYFPNHDAALVLCRDVIPRVLEQSSESMVFRFVGGGADSRLRRIIRNTEGAEFVGPVEQIEAAYAGVDGVVVPINAGGGTRIKILEAFAFGKPVVSTPLGAEGIECEDGVHLLLADSAQQFASQCQRLTGSPQLCASLASAATELLRRKYSPDQLINL